MAEFGSTYMNPRQVLRNHGAGLPSPSTSGLSRLGRGVPKSSRFGLFIGKIVGSLVNGQDSALQHIGPGGVRLNLDNLHNFGTSEVVNAPPNLDP